MFDDDKKMHVNIYMEINTRKFFHTNQTTFLLPNNNNTKNIIYKIIFIVLKIYLTY